MKKPGSLLRDKVCDLLKLTYRNVMVEYALTATTADIFYIDDRNQNFPNKIAIECKDWKSPLTSANLSTINNLYRPSILNGEIDYLWIISNHEIGQSPADTVKKMGKIVYSTYSEFLSSIMNFSLLLEDNVSAFKNHDSSRNFIELTVEKSNESLENVTRRWMAGDKKALIIYGGMVLVKRVLASI